MIEFDEPTTLADTIWKMKYCYNQSKHKPNVQIDCNKNDKAKFKGKGSKSYWHRKMGKNSKFTTPTKGGFQQNFLTDNRYRPTKLVREEASGLKRGPF